MFNEDEDRLALSTTKNIFRFSTSFFPFPHFIVSNVSFHDHNYISIVFPQREVMVYVVKKRKPDFVNLLTGLKRIV